MRQRRLADTPALDRQQRNRIEYLPQCAVARLARRRLTDNGQCLIKPAKLGQRGEAKAAVVRLSSDQRPYQFGAADIARARIASLLGDTTTAIAALRRAFARGREYDLWVHRTREFEAIRSNPAFLELVLLK